MVDSPKMPTEIQWRSKKIDGKRITSQWQHHTTIAAADAPELVKIWNYHSPFFEYRSAEVETKPPPKPKQGPFAFSFANKGKGKAPEINPRAEKNPPG